MATAVAEAACVATGALGLAPPHPRCEVAVAVPARDEASSVAATVAALADQREADGARFDPTRYEVILFANGCADGTADAARAAGAAARRRAPGFRLHVVEAELPAEASHSGGARRAAMELVRARLATLGTLPGGRSRVIATTDADTEVARDWLTATLAELARGADAVGGRVVARDLDRLPAAARALYLYDVGYHHLAAAVDALVDPEPHDPWPRHPQHFGASLAVTLDAYDAVGGLPAAPALEDVRFVEQLARGGFQLRHSPAVRARTSARPDGRARDGLARQITRWVAAGDGRWAVESAAVVEGWAGVRAALRRRWGAARAGGARVAGDDPLAAALCLAPAALDRLVTEPRPFLALVLDEELRARYLRGWDAARRGPPREDVRAAVPKLRARLGSLRAGAR